MKDFQLYVITCPPSEGWTYKQMVEAACRGGADVIQFRDKNLPARELVSLGRGLLDICRHFGVTFIVNDRPDVALAIGADGVHLGQEDLPVRDAREFLGPKAVIGLSTHSLSQALAASVQGADYIGVGPVFSTPTKPRVQAVGLELVRAVHQQVSVPFVAIGGIDHSNVEDVLKAGAKRVAVVRAVCAAKDMELAARSLKEKIAAFQTKKERESVRS